MKKEKEKENERQKRRKKNKKKKKEKKRKDVKMKRDLKGVLPKTARKIVFSKKKKCKKKS